MRLGWAARTIVVTLLAAGAASTQAAAHPDPDGWLLFTKDLLESPLPITKVYAMANATPSPGLVGYPGHYYYAAESLEFHFPVRDGWTYLDDSVLRLPMVCHATAPPLGAPAYVRVMRGDDVSVGNSVTVTFPLCTAGQETVATATIPTRFLRLIPGDVLVVDLGAAIGSAALQPDGSGTTASIEVGAADTKAGLRGNLTRQPPVFALEHNHTWDSTSIVRHSLHWTTTTDAAQLSLAGNVTGTNTYLRIHVRDLLTRSTILQTEVESADGTARLDRNFTLPAGPEARWTIDVEAYGTVGDYQLRVRPVVLQVATVVDTVLPSGNATEEDSRGPSAIVPGAPGGTAGPAAGNATATVTVTGESTPLGAAVAVGALAVTAFAGRRRRGA